MLGAAPASGAPLDASASRGRELYTGGSGAGSIRATLAGGVEVSAAQHPCVQCHGPDGRGGSEGGVVVSDIRWARLTSPHGVPTFLGGLRPPYTDASLRRAIRSGVDPSGAPLDPLMPRYELGDAALDDLLAYLRVLGSEFPPGVEDARIRVGSLLPLDGVGAAAGRAALAALEAALARTNASGGIAGRRIELVARDAGPSSREAVARARSMLDGPEPVFCFVANAGSGAATEVLALLGETGIPVVGPLVLAPGDPARGSVFHLLAGLDEHGRAAAQALARDPSAGPVALVEGRGPGALELVRAFAAEAERGGVSLVVRARSSDDPADLARRLRAAGARTLAIFASRIEADSLLSALEPLHWQPPLLLSAVLLAAPPPRWPERVTLVAPALAKGADRAGDDAVAGLGFGGPSDPSARNLALAAVAAARTLAAGLAAAGRDLTRAGLVEGLSGVRGLETGVMPPVSFGPTRRLGVSGALLLEIDSRGRATSAAWVEPERGL